jgi:hypothetical protein
MKRITAVMLVLVHISAFAQEGPALTLTPDQLRALVKEEVTKALAAQQPKVRQYVPYGETPEGRAALAQMQAETTRLANYNAWYEAHKGKSMLQPAKLEMKPAVTVTGGSFATGRRGCRGGRCGIGLFH